MKRLAARSLPEKVMMAAIILSCGLVMQAEPGALKGKKAGEAGRLQKSPAVHDSRHAVNATKPVATPHQLHPAW